MILRNTVLTLYSSANTARIEIFTLIQRENQPSLQRHKQLLAISFATNFSDAAFSRFFAAVSAEILRMIFIIFTSYKNVIWNTNLMICFLISMELNFRRVAYSMFMKQKTQYYSNNVDDNDDLFDG